MRLLFPCLLIVIVTACGEPKYKRGVARVIARGPNQIKPTKPVEGDPYVHEFVKLGEEHFGQQAIREIEVTSVEAVLYHPSAAPDFVHPLCTGQDLNPEGQDWQRVDSVSCSAQRKIFLSLVNWKSFGTSEKRKLVLQAYSEVLLQKSSL